MRIERASDGLRRIALVALLMAFCSTVTRASDAPVAPKLENVERQTLTPRPPNAGDAVPLPGTVTICRDSHAQRCWTEAGATDCRSEATADGTVFRQVANNADPGHALRQCWADLHR